jgi:hypothetical protein
MLRFGGNRISDLIPVLFIYLQRPALIPFHSLELKLIDGEGKWELCTIRQ